ncbi:MAG: Type-1 restriction enzyme EcoKI specificity protein [Acinetobacter bereziniae]|uniref:Type-1 restriction enzyme EcoKI specificity protein n=1 Tax=Acinetobacter bereziniae TaxID=106648 RepID=A0A833PHX6_ACIBZ|nr:MAG: Type-1 restriction enzyme EcoKI specificity protein [Acinetobacter bereziniae]
MENQKCPEIRFKGFNQTWIEKKLKSVSFKVIEKNLNSLYTETFTNSAQFGVVSQRDFFDKDISNSSSIKGYYVVKENDFIYNPRISNFAPVGPIKRNKLGRIGVVSPLYFVFRVHGLDYQFLETYFESSKWHHFMFLNGDTGARSDRLAIKNSILIEMPIYCPDEKTQKDIGKFFQHLDQSIALHEKKLNQTQNLKKAMLEKMFPTAESNKQPEIRLKGFSGEWEEFQLENLGEFKNGMNMDKDSMGFGNPFVNIQHIFESTEVTKHNLELVNATNKQKKDYNLLKGDVLFVRSSVKLEGVGDTAVLVDDIEGATYSGFLIRFRSNINLSLDYKKVMFSIPLVRKQILANATTSANTNINQESLKKILILLPKYEEQTQIGLFFKQLDETLVLQQQHLQTLKNLKQAFLEKMFV